MSLPTAPEGFGTSTRPYLIRALHEWCRDNGYTPYIAVHVDGSVRVPPEYVKNREIVLNVGFEATNGLVIGNDFIEFKARFGGAPREIVVPVSHVIAIYARENGQGMAFPVPPEAVPAEAPQPGAAEAATPLVGTPHLALAQGPSQPGRGASSAPAAPPGETASSPDPAAPPLPPEPAGPGGRPTLKRIK